MKSNPLDEFDPNEAGVPWASYCPSRRAHGASKLRVHRLRAHALSAIGNHASYWGAILYERKDGKWVEVVRYQPRAFIPQTCSNCGGSTMEIMSVKNPSYRWPASNGEPPTIPDPTGRMGNTGKQFLERDGRGKLVEPLTVLTLCITCRSVLGY